MHEVLHPRASSLADEEEAKRTSITHSAEQRCRTQPTPTLPFALPVPCRSLRTTPALTLAGDPERPSAHPRHNLPANGYEQAYTRSHPIPRPLPRFTGAKRWRAFRSSPLRAQEMRREAGPGRFVASPDLGPTRGQPHAHPLHPYRRHAPRPYRHARRGRRPCPPCRPCPEVP